MCIDTMYENEQHSDKPLGFGAWWHISYHHHYSLVYLRYGFCVIKTTFPFRRSAQRTPLELPPFPKNHFQDSSNKWKSSLWMCKSSPIRIHSGRIVLGTGFFMDHLKGRRCLRTLTSCGWISSSNFKRFVYWWLVSLWKKKSVCDMCLMDRLWIHVASIFLQFSQN